MIRALIFTLAAIAAGAQQPQRDTSSITTIRIGTASVSGVVTLGDEVQTPVRRAVVTVVSTDGVETRSTVGDDNGRFTIGGLPAGRYTLQTLKPAHLTMAFGARRPGRPGTALVVTDGQSIVNLSLTLPRGAVLAGRLTLANGEPLANTQVQAIPARLTTSGGPASAATQRFQTDDLGEYRIYGLLPDTYVLAALPTFGIGELQRRSEQDFDAIVRALQQRTPTPAGKPAPRTDPVPPAEVVGYAPTYFPGTPIATDATPIVVRAGEVRDGLGFTVSAVPKATISGTVLDAGGAPAPASYVSAELVGPPLAVSLAMSSAPRNSRPNARGEFSITGVGPGRYRIRAHARSSTSPTEWALAEVNVSGGDIAGLTLTLQPGRVFSGRLLAESAAAPASWSGALVALQPTTGNPGMVLTGVGGNNAAARATVGGDGRFAVTGLVPNDYRVSVTVPPALVAGGWTLASIRHRGRDVRDAPLTFNDGSLESVEIVLTTAVTELAGRLTSASVASATDYFVVAFPEDRGLWHPASPRIRVMRPGADGAFSTRDLPPGAYRLATLTDVEDDDLKRSEFLESIYDAGVRVTVETGKRTMQELRITK